MPTLQVVKKPLNSKYGTQYTEQQIKELVNDVANKYKVDASQMLETIRCESVNFRNLQSGHILGVNNNASDKDGRENSWGLAQINLYWHPNVSKKEALTPEFAVEFMGKQFSQGKQNEWTCFRNLYN